MRAYILGGLLLCGIAAGTASMAAHHSFTAEFDGNKKVTMTGIVTKVVLTLIMSPASTSSGVGFDSGCC